MMQVYMHDEEAGASTVTGEKKERLTLYDCSCSFGARGIVNPGSFYKVEDLVRKMVYYGIQKALVYHAMAREYNPELGNRRLMEEIKDYPQLYPVWVVMPHHTCEFPQPEKLRDQLRENGIRAVRMFPGVSDQNYSIDSWNCGELFNMLQSCGIPLFIGLDQLAWHQLYALHCEYPNLKVVLTDVHYRIDRNLYALLKQFGNLHVETYGYKVHHGIEELCSRFGAHRLIFGSSMPVFSGGSAVSMINYARISAREKRMIACDNLENLLGGVHFE